MKKAWLGLGIMLFLAAGCGHKGPLYIPQSQKPAPKTVPAQPEPPAQDGASSK